MGNGSKSLIVFILIGLMCTPPVSAETKRAFSLSGIGSSDGGISEYYYKNSPNDVLVPIRLLGQVSRPGIYHVPLKTPLVNLLSISGGPNPSADTEEIMIKREKANTTETVDLESSIRSGQEIVMQHGDTVWVPTKTKTFGENTVATLSLVSLVLSVVISGIVVSNNIR